MRRINWEAFIQSLILIGCAIGLAALLITGQIRSYVHPRIEKYAWFAVIALILMAASMLPMIRQPKRKNNWLPLYIIIIPLLTGFIMPATTNMSSLQMDNSLIPKSSAALSSISPDSNSTETADTSDSSASISTTTTEPFSSGTAAGNTSLSSGITTASTATGTTAASETAGNGGIEVVKDDQFLVWCTKVSNNLSDYVGKTVKVKGFVYREKEFASNEFVPARKCMVCCAADITACGFLCRSSDAQKWADNTWVWVTGVIQKEYSKDYQTDVPVLKAVKIESAEKPENELAYLY